VAESTDQIIGRVLFDRAETGKRVFNIGMDVLVLRELGRERLSSRSHVKIRSDLSDLMPPAGGARLRSGLAETRPGHCARRFTSAGGRSPAPAILRCPAIDAGAPIRRGLCLAGAGGVGSGFGLNQAAKCARRASTASVTDFMAGSVNWAFVHFAWGRAVERRRR
jgi:hypothetical protein